MKEDRFFSGIVSALAIVAAHDESTLYNEIVEASGRENIYKAAKRDGALRWIKWNKYAGKNK